MARADRQELVDRFEQFYRSYYREEIGELAQNYPSEQRSLYVDWNDLFTFDQDLADDYLSQPEQLQEYAEEALRLYDLPVDVSLGQAHVRVHDLPESTAIREIRSRHVNTLISVSGIVRKATSVRPKIQEAAFECQRCGTLSRIPQSGGDFQEPHECQGCERQGPFTINFDQSEFVDSQQLRIQESPEGLRGGQTPENIDVHIEDDLTGEVSPGDHVTATGVLHLEQQGSNNEQSAVFDVYMDGVSVQLDDEEFEEMDIDETDKREIIERSGEDDIYEQMVESMAPSIYGLEDEKLAIILQLFSGVTKHLPDGSRTRGDLHVLLIGDPGTGKCSKGDTKVTLADGSEREIRDLVEGHLDDPTPVDDGVYDEVEFEVPSMDAEGRMTTRTARKVWKREAPERMYRIETGSGHTVEVTPSHPLFVQRDGQPTPIEADELEGNEFIATPRRIPTNPVDSLEIDYRESKANNAVRLDLPERWTPSLARLIGYIIAEGHVVLNDDHTGDVRVTNNDREILDDVEQALEHLGLNYSEEKAHKDKRAREVRCNSGEFTSFLANLEPAILQASAEQRVPDALMATSDSIKREFLRAYVDSEGHVAETQREISIASASRELLEDIRSLLLSVGIGAQLEERNNGSSRLRISGKDFDRYVDSVGFVTDRKSTVASSYSDIKGNTNTDVVPGLAEDLRRIRTKLRLSQSECGLSRSTYQHYERGDRNPSRANLRNVVNAFADRIEDLRTLRSRVADGDWTDIKTARDELNISQQSLASGMDVTQTAVSYYERNEVIPDGGEVVDAKQVVFDCLDDALSVESDVRALKNLAKCDVSWDRIKSIEPVDPDYDWVYDLEVEDTHSYVSNNVVSHNSQLLQYIRNIAPRSVYTSGKGSSAAGLCVTGDTRVHTPEGFAPIRELATEHHPEPVTEETAAEAAHEVYTFDRDGGDIGRAESSHVWRMPEKPCRKIETAYGKELEASRNTPLLVCGDAGLEWREIADVEPGDQVAVPKYDGLERSSPEVRDFVEFTGEKLKPTDESVEFLLRRLREEFGTLRDAAAALDLSEDFIYDSLSNRHLPLDKLGRVLEAIGAELGDIDIERAMLRHGDGVAIPDAFDEDLLYLVGLVFGDGDVMVSRRGGNRGHVRISNSNEALLEDAAAIIERTFGKSVEIEHQEDRVPCIRLHSATVARLFSNLGVESPKDDIALAPALTTADHADALLRGLFDADGCVSVRDDGGSSIQFSTTCDELARQVQLMLESYGIRAQRRERDRRGTYELADGQEVESTSVQTHLTIYGRDIDAFADEIGFKSTRKSEQLAEIVRDRPRCGERLPVGDALVQTDGAGGQYYQNLNRGDDPSRERAMAMLEDRDLGEVADVVEEVAGAGLRWDEVTAATDTGRKEVFDLTVPGTNNFLGNGVVTHNTAAAVRDDFGEGQQWSLEAGALVLADRGIAAIDELDKMRCVTGDTLVNTGDGRVSRIRELAREAAESGTIEPLDNGRTIRDVDLTVWTMTEDDRLVRRPVSAVHEYDAPETLTEVTLETGESVTTTDDHPFFVMEDGERITKPAADVDPGEWVYVPREIPSAVGDGGAAVATPPKEASTGDMSPDLAAVLGYLAGDGNVYYDRDEGVYGIRFTNAEEELLADFERACRRAFDAEPVRPPSEQREDGVETVRVHGKEYADAVLDAGMNLETYDGKTLPEGVTRGSREAKAAFVRALADSEGHVEKRNVKLFSSSHDLLLGVKSLLLEFGISSQIQTRPRTDGRDVYVLAITAADSLAAFDDHIGFTLDRKQRALDEVCETVSGDRTIIDVIPNVGEQMADLRDTLRLHQSECGIDAVTYCNFENGDANASIDRARDIIDAFEARTRTAGTDLETLQGECDWDELATLKERYHVSQSELAEGTAYSQSQVSSKWGEDTALHEAVQDRLASIVAEVAAVDIGAFRELVEGDVKWRRVDSVGTVDATVRDDRVPVIESELAEIVGCSTDGAAERARELLGQQPSVGTWDALREELERYGISFATLSDDLGVAGSTVSRWFNGVVETDRFDEVRAVADERIRAKRQRMRELLEEIEERQRPKVYDLTVEDTHNFVANGMVVHNSEDRSAMHEGLEQQSYHPDEEVLLADGRRVAIGDLVDSRMDAEPETVVDGVDCEILPVDDLRVHSVDLDENAVEKVPVDRVSRHEAPEAFVEVTFSNGRSVTVTPEHPMFVDDGGEVGTVEASDLKEGAFVPAPRKLPNSSASVPLDDEPHRGKEKDVAVPDELTPDLAEAVGLLVAEGHSYAGSSHEIGFSNQDERLLDRMDGLMGRVFGMESTDVTSEEGTVTKRWVSTKLYRWFERNVPEVMATAREKRIPAAVLGASEEEIRRFLMGAFAGDGGVESESMAFATASRGLAEDYADALSKLGVASRIHYNAAEDSWKTYVMGDSIGTFVDAVVDPADERYERAAGFAEASRRLDTPGERTDLRYYRVTDVETVPNEGEHACEWVYDVTVEPTNTFVSKGVVLHNSISISKAGINATLKSRCSLLGAANPKYGRFDEYEPIAEQIDLEPALVSRFDLIFTVTDKPDAEQDKRLAEHILQTNYAGELNTQRTQLEAANVTDEQIDRATESVSPTLDAEFLRKYVAFAKRSCFPTMTEEAKERIRDFYTDLRAKGEGEDNPVPVTARKLEALVRLAEASARVRLSDEVELEDAERVIDVVYASLEDIGVDPETGQYDADVVETGTSKSQRDRIKNLKGLVEDIAGDYEEGAPVEEVLDRAEEIGLEPSKAEHEIEKLKQQGELYEPSTDHLRTT